MGISVTNEFGSFLSVLFELVETVVLDMDLGLSIMKVVSSKSANVFHLRI